ncbi:ribonuclease III [Anaerosalibacter bizertensis]|uniref:Ribonuclease 3 n=2 Tax=Anaerosalibacter bizertensis TaxID=932217 RepID=A0A9Q4A9Y0_9FIRM|nr:ribonuclease III [Anaerosalibacter bizertensis]MBV1816581.1 ribonuclease III [Bacteroidales bacterium MSK.15.36]MCB5558615.1 ribonuclease III [Anaerosalibacter bizertensis]MCG4563968.1 ribonuclease III [Anaerosalibacter bizertensis]MCG4581907.1 ribonuclease III [Anaerosalibacter bizertensis]MCG4584652.1 ribonuclease III [Anaerosalibacter bizertensis]
MKKNNREKAMCQLQNELNFIFKDITLLNGALTHSSYANEHRKTNMIHNERLEFLGDSVLNLAVSDYIYKKYPYYPEGNLTKIRATVVCESALALIAKKIKLGDYLLLGKGEEATGGRNRDSILADALEALIGAMYLDKGFRDVQRFVIRLLEKEIIEASKKGELFIDYKTKLQETLQRNRKASIEYKIVKEEGPDHDKKFHILALIDKEEFGRGYGRSKKEAEQRAAKEVLIRMGVKDE